MSESSFVPFIGGNSLNRNENNIVLYTSKDIQAIFSCGRKKAYQIMHVPTFPTIKINGGLYVEKEELEKWIQRNKKKTILFH